MAKREVYLRVVLFREGVEYILGLELRPTDELGVLRAAMKRRIHVATGNLLPGKWDDIAYAIEATTKKHWPDRAYFIEVGDERNGWVQVWDPVGFVKERCTCRCSI